MQTCIKMGEVFCVRSLWYFLSCFFLSHVFHVFFSVIIIKNIMYQHSFLVLLSKGSDMDLVKFESPSTWIISGMMDSGQTT